ncbi:uncharacterized protein N0V89_003534 [Didymosphaeria variabile]|uniref:Uncharacterized protein n=1 Tax=Didymosphaeria variabile TaxID=1932322 RepID=A0A9W8XNX4_9PLEO|nr:uncharacterized protein N0V89_003534 [Didymosphaeria variabile]KAJ4355517.1 hypothetical protein N0V89_003534 [Didymosphaeria variabile]
MPPKQKPGRQQNAIQGNGDTPSSREQELEAQVAELQKQLRITMSNHREQLQTANTFDTNHYIEVMDRVEELQEQNEQLKAKLNEAPETLGRQGQEQSTADHLPIFEPVIVLPKELKPSKDGHTLQLIDLYTRKKEELLQHKEGVAKERQETIEAIYTARRRIREFKAQTRSAHSQGADSTQLQMLATYDVPQEVPASEQSLEHPLDAHMPLEPPPIDAYPALTSNHPSTYMGPSSSTPLIVYSEVGQNVAQTLKFVRYRNVSSFEKNEQNVSDADGEEDEHKDGESVSGYDESGTE